MRCYVDCRDDERLSNDFQTLNLWGKPVFLYVLEALSNCKYIESINVVSNSKKVINIINDSLIENVTITSQIDKGFFPRMHVSGRAAFLKSSTIRKAIERSFENGGVYVV